MHLLVCERDRSDMTECTTGGLLTQAAGLSGSAMRTFAVCATPLLALHSWGRWRWTHMSHARLALQPRQKGLVWAARQARLPTPPLAALPGSRTSDARALQTVLATATETKCGHRQKPRRRCEVATPPMHLLSRALGSGNGRRGPVPHHIERGCSLATPLAKSVTLALDERGTLCRSNMIHAPRQTATFPSPSLVWLLC